MVRQRSAKPLFAGSIPAVASTTLRINLPRPFHFVHTVESHGWYRLAPFRWSAHERTLRRAELLGGRAVELTIRSRRGKLEVETSWPVAPEDLYPRLRRMFQLHVDLTEFHALCRASATHAWVLADCFGRLLCGSTLFEDAVKIIATTNTTWSQTVRMVALLVEKCGTRSDGGQAAFPEPEQIARFRAEELQRDCKLGYRATSIHRLASGIAAGSIALDRIAQPQQTSEELFRSYQLLPGIGPYGAAHLLAMDGRHDFIAVDTEFRRFVREQYHGGRKVSDRAMLRHYARWGRWRYLAYWSELWRGVAERLQPRG